MTVKLKDVFLGFKHAISSLWERGGGRITHFQVKKVLEV